MHLFKNIFNVLVAMTFAAALPFGAGIAQAASTTPTDPAINPISGQPIMRSLMTADQRKAAAARAAATRSTAKSTQDKQLSSIAGPLAVPLAPTPGGTPDYFGVYPNYANSPLPVVDPISGAVISGGIRKFVDTLPGVGASNANNLGQYIPVANKIAPPPGVPADGDYYEIGVVDYTEQMHSDLPVTHLRGYKDLSPSADPQAHYLGPLIIAQRNVPVRIKFTNLLPTSDNPASFLTIPVDITAMGAGTGPDPLFPLELYTQNRATLHLHGGASPWISDGTPHQWITPAGDPTHYKTGLSLQNVPDMFGGNPGDGSSTFYWSNQQSSRLMFYHDHSYGITRLNVYAGEAAGYLLTDPVEEGLIDKGVIPGLGETVYRYGIPLIIQDKTFVPDNTTPYTNVLGTFPSQLTAQDPTWNWGGYGDLWFPHVYMTNQNPEDLSGANAMGRWDYGPWFWPPVTSLNHMPVPNPYFGQPGEPTEIPGTPNPSLAPEAFMDTPLVNGTAYPVLQVGRKAYRFRILNAANDRSWNLQLYYADPDHPTEVKMVPAVPHPGDPTWPDTWPTDSRAGGVPDPTTAGPDIIQIGTEGGFLPAPVVIPSTPTNFNYNRRDIVVLNVSTHGLELGPAERADVIVDFSQVPDGSKLILYNDAPAPFPAFDTRYDYYTGDPDQSDTGGAPSTAEGYGPNTRTIMQFQVTGAAAGPYNVDALNAAFASSTPYPGVTQPGVFAADQDPVIVPQSAYNSAYNATFTDTFSRIQDTSLDFAPLGTNTPADTAMLSKTIQELFELDYGRMNAILGLEMPFTNFNTQTTIPMGYVDPITENMQNDQTQIWKITHNGVDTHAIHFHLFNVQLINRVGWDGAIRPPEPNELGWKETVRMNPLEDCIVAIRPVAPTLPFAVPDSVRPMDVTKQVGDPITVVNPADGNLETIPNNPVNMGWEYVWHCHLLGHEENDMMRAIAFSVPALLVPGAPIIGTAVAGDSQATVGFFPPLSNGGSAITSYTVTSSPDGLTATGTISPITVTGLTNGTPYTFTVTAANPQGTGSASDASNIVTPGASVPWAPIMGTAVPGAAQATVNFTAPAYDGGSAITAYTVTALVGGVPTLITTTGAASPIIVTGLTNGTAYTFTVTATNATGTSLPSAASNTITPVTLPDAPVIGTAVRGNQQVTVSFSPPPSNGGSPILSYTATALIGSVPTLITATGAASPIIVTGLTNGTAYTFTVTATNAVGTGPVSAESNVVTPATVPDAPVIGAATATDSQATVNFTTSVSDGGSPILSYTATSNPDGKTATIAGPLAAPITVTGLTNGTTYTFTVVATNDVGPSLPSSASNSVTPLALPGAPVIGTSTWGDSQATVSFTPPASDGGSPILYYTATSNPGGITATLSAPFGTPPLSVTVGGLTNGTAYSFTVTATTANGTGPASAPSNIVTPATPPGAPIIGSATAGNAQATVSFTAPVSDGGSTITSYTATALVGGVPTAITATGATGPLLVTGLTNGTTYTFTVTATNAAGTSIPSAQSNPVTPTTTFPAKPTLLKAVGSVLGPNPPTVSLTWVDNSTNEAGFIILRATNSSFTLGLTTFSVGMNTVAYTDSSVLPKTKYYYKVYAYNTLGNSAYSNTVGITTAGQTPLAPSGLAVVLPTTRTSISLSWTDNSTNETGFYLQRSTTGTGSWSTIAKLPVGTTAFTSTGLTPNRTYYYRAQAYNASGKSAFSNVVSGTTLP